MASSVVVAGVLSAVAVVRKAAKYKLRAGRVEDGYATFMLFAKVREVLSVAARCSTCLAHPRLSSPQWHNCGFCCADVCCLCLDLLQASDAPDRQCVWVELELAAALLRQGVVGKVRRC